MLIHARQNELLAYQHILAFDYQLGSPFPSATQSHLSNFSPRKCAIRNE